MVLILIQQQFPSTFFLLLCYFCLFFCSPSQQPLQLLCFVLSRFSEYTSWWHFFPSHSSRFFVLLCWMFLCFLCVSSEAEEEKQKKNQEQKLQHKGKMVMPDVICVPNNNKAIHQAASESGAAAYKKRSLLLFALTPLLGKFPTLFNREGFSVLFPSGCSPCFHNILRVDNVFHAIFRRSERGWCCSWAHYCSYYYSFLSLLTRRLSLRITKAKWFTGARICLTLGETDFLLLLLLVLLPFSTSQPSHICDVGTCFHMLWWWWHGNIHAS